MKELEGVSEQLGGKKKHHNIEVVSSKGSAWSMRLTDTKSYNKWTRRRIITSVGRISELNLDRI